MHLLEEQMQNAFDWERNTTGAGLMYGSDIEKASFQETLLKMQTL